MVKYRCNKTKISIENICYLLNGKFEIIPIGGQPASLIILPNGNLVCSTYPSVMLLNESFEHIEIISPGGNYCAVNCRNEIYVSIFEKNCILLFDLNLNQLQQFGTRGLGNNQLDHPQGLCCHDDYLYICDYGNKRVQILTLDMIYESTIDLEDCPDIIQISEKTIGVCCYKETFFFDLKTRTMNYKFCSNCNLNYIDSIFYVLDFSNIQTKIYFHDTTGKFIEWIYFDGDYLTRLPGGILFQYKNHYYMSTSENKLLKFIEKK